MEHGKILIYSSLNSLNFRKLRNLRINLRSRLGVGNVGGRHDDNITGPTDCDSALTFRNINTNSVHNGYSFSM